jgi:glutathione S-transferase
VAEYRLYCFAQSGNAYKAALMLSLCGADWEPRFVDFFNGETRTPEFRKINEMGEVPVLEHRQMRLSQSGVILDYLAGRFGKFGWADEDERREILRWLLWDNHKLTSYIGTLRFLIRFMKTGETPVTEFLRGRMKSALAILDAHLQGRSFVLGERPTIADLSLCGYLYFADEFAVDWADYPDIGAWLGRIRALPGWVHPYELMPGHPLPDRS